MPHSPCAAHWLIARTGLNSSSGAPQSLKGKAAQTQCWSPARISGAHSCHSQQEIIYPSEILQPPHNHWSLSDTALSGQGQHIHWSIQTGAAYHGKQIHGSGDQLDGLNGLASVGTKNIFKISLFKCLPSFIFKGKQEAQGRKQYSQLRDGKGS